MSSEIPHPAPADSIMSQSSVTPAGNDAPTKAEEQPEPLSFTLLVVSPSVGVNSPLTFPNFPASTTVKQLKAKIRDVVPSKPADERQRVIYRGRLLSRDEETMLEIFRLDTPSNSESQTLHLVLRDDSVQTTTAPPPARPQSIPPNLLQSQTQITPAVPAQGMHAQQPLPGFQHVQQHQALHQAEQMHNAMTLRLQGLQIESQRLQREIVANEQRHRASQAALAAGIANGQQAMPIANPLQVQPGFPGNLPVQFGVRIPQAMTPTVQGLIAQQQRERAVEGRGSAQDRTASPARASVSGRASPNVLRPDHTHTYTREGIGPNGERWQMTVNETTTTLPMAQPHFQHAGHHQHQPVNPALDIQAVLRNADRFLAAQNSQNAQNNMRRSASNPAPSSAAQAGPSTTATAVTQPSTPGQVTTPSVSIIPNPIVQANAQAPNTATSPSAEPTVFILSSPQGPRALLVSNSETYFTPRQSRRHRLDFAATNPLQAQGQAPVGLPEYRNRGANRPQRRNRNQNGDPVQPINGGHANPAPGALAARIGPAVWLAARLIFVIWWFASGNTSWARWFLVSGFAFGIFLYNVGALNEIGDQLFGPVRRHLQNLIPLAGPEAALVPAVNAAVPQPGAAPATPTGNEQAYPATGGEPDPAQVAARLVQQHREANGGWIMTQVRRAEHALLLFLASLVPGVGERHIAHREAEANAAEAERQRRLIEAAAAAAAALNSEGEAAGVEGQTETAGDNQASDEQAPAAPAPPPLVEV